MIGEIFWSTVGVLDDMFGFTDRPSSHTSLSTTEKKKPSKAYESCLRALREGDEDLRDYYHSQVVKYTEWRDEAIHNKHSESTIDMYQGFIDKYEIDYQRKLKELNES